ncbi:phosphodiester glycosidase family protein [bacterium]|nr:phosphodiester glycosidase family protein [bacterium]
MKTKRFYRIGLLVLALLPFSSVFSEDRRPFFLDKEIFLEEEGLSCELLSLKARETPTVFKIEAAFNKLPTYKLSQSGDLKEIILDFLKTYDQRYEDAVSRWTSSLIKEIKIEQRSDNSLRMKVKLGREGFPYIYTLPYTGKLILEIRESLLPLREPVKEPIEYLSFFHQGLKVNLLKVDLSSPEILIQPALAKEKIYGLEKPSSMARRKRAAAAINGTFFTPSTGKPLGMVMIDGRMVSEPILSRTVFGITRSKKILFGPISFNATISLANQTIKVDGINRKRQRREVVIYTPEYGLTTKTKDGMEITIVNGQISSVNSSNSYIPGEGYVLSIGPDGPDLEEVRLFREAKLDLGLDGEWKDVLYALGGGPRLVKEGKIYITSKLEKFRPDVALSQAARSAIGVTKDRKLLLVTVDSATLKELANLMIGLGAEEAMNLDGGGSSTLVYRDWVVNSPQGQSERAVSNALLVFER